MLPGRCSGNLAKSTLTSLLLNECVVGRPVAAKVQKFSIIKLSNIKKSHLITLTVYTNSNIKSFTKNENPFARKPFDEDSPFRIETAKVFVTIKQIKILCAFDGV
jgi:hypothetical protein